MTGIGQRLVSIRGRIDAALERVGAQGRAVTIIAVTKGHPAERVDAAAAAGLLNVGENRVMEALEKAERVCAPVRWHLIGHLQRNKVGRAVRLFDCIHSVDSVRLAHAVGGTGKPLEVLLQINVSGEEAKQGVSPEGARALWQAALGHASLRVAGLMTMAPRTEKPGEVRPVFRTLRQLRDSLNAHGDGPPLGALSMGMSGDYEIAVEEGATHVRLGTALVGVRNPGPGPLR